METEFSTQSKSWYDKRDDLNATNPVGELMAGRPSKYKSEYCELLIEHMASGLSFESFAAVIDVSRASLYTWLEHYKAFSDAKKKATDKCLLFWEKMGVAGTVGLPEMVIKGKSVKLRAFSPAMWIYNMKCRFRENWLQETQEVANATIKLAYEPKTQREKREHKS